MKAEAFFSATKAIQLGESSRRLRCAGVLRRYRLPLYAAIFEEAWSDSMHLFVATMDPDDQRLSTFDVRCDIRSPRGFLGATNPPGDDLIAEHTSIFVPDKGESEAAAIGSCLLEPVPAFKELNID